MNFFIQYTILLKNETIVLIFIKLTEFANKFLAYLNFRKYNIRRKRLSFFIIRLIKFFTHLCTYFFIIECFIFCLSNLITFTYIT